MIVKPGRNREPGARHLGEPGSLPAQKIAHPGMPLFEGIDALGDGNDGGVGRTRKIRHKSPDLRRKLCFLGILGKRLSGSFLSLKYF